MKGDICILISSVLLCCDLLVCNINSYHFIFVRVIHQCYYAYKQYS